jgi:hypothetical protein
LSEICQNLNISRILDAIIFKFWKISDNLHGIEGVETMSRKACVYNGST